MSYQEYITPLFEWGVERFVYCYIYGFVFTYYYFGDFIYIIIIFFYYILIIIINYYYYYYFFLWNYFISDTFN